MPRSGTTLLYKLLCLHPDAAYISNWMRTAPAVPALALANRLTPRFADTRRATWFGADRANAYVNGEPMVWRKQLFPRPVEGEPFYRSCGIAVPDSAGRPDMGRLQRLPGMLGAVCRYGGGRVFVSKYLANNHHIPARAELFPSAPFREHRSRRPSRGLLAVQSALVARPHGLVVRGHARTLAGGGP